MMPEAEAQPARELLAQAAGEASLLSKEAVGSALKLARRARGFTQQQLSERTGLSQSMISDAERGEVLKFENLNAIIDALGIRMSALIAAAERIQEAHGTTRKVYEGIVELMNLTEPDQLDKIIQAGVDRATKFRRTT